MLALRQAAIALGYQAQGWRLGLSDLPNAGPVLAHVVLDGEHHFTVLLGANEHFAYLADPSLGYIAMPLEEFAQAFSGAVLKVSLADAPVQAKEEGTAGEVAAVGEEVLPEAEPAGEASVSEEVPAEAVALETAAAPLAEADVTPEAGEVVVEAPATDEDPTYEETPISQPAAEPIEDALPGQAAAEPLADKAPAEYHGYGPADTPSAAEETPLAPAEDKAAARVLDEAEMENIFGCRGAWRTRNRQTVDIRVNINWGEVLGTAIGGAVGGAIGGAVAGPKGAALGAVGGFVGGAVASLVTQTLNHYWR